MRLDLSDGAAHRSVRSAVIAGPPPPAYAGQAFAGADPTRGPFPTSRCADRFPDRACPAKACPRVGGGRGLSHDVNGDGQRLSALD
jgi:hypothetical protein